MTLTQVAQSMQGKSDARLTAEERVAFHQMALSRANERLSQARAEVAALQREVCQAQHLLEHVR